MFGIGFGELLVIGVLLLIAVGPRRMPVMMKSMGRAMREFRKATRELRAQVGLDELMGEDDVLRPMKKVPRPVRPATSHAAPSATAQNAPPSTTSQNAPPSTTAQNAAPSVTTQKASPSITTHQRAIQFGSSDDPSADASTEAAEEDDALAAERARLREYPPDGVDIDESRDAAARASRTIGAATSSAATSSAATSSAATSSAATNAAATNDAATNGSARALASAPLASAKKAQA